MLDLKSARSRASLIVLAASSVLSAGCAAGDSQLSSGNTTGSSGSTATASVGSSSAGSGGSGAGTGGAGGAAAGTGGAVAGTGGAGASTSSASTGASSASTSASSASTSSASTGTGGAGGVVQVFHYDEELATVLRAVQIDAGAATQLGVQPGYYQLTAWRVSNQPSETAIALEIDKGYAACAIPANSLLPVSSDPWVFFNVSSTMYDATGYQQTASDSYGHVLSFQILFGASCFTVASSSLNGVSVGLTTKTYTTDVFNTCGWASEPALTGPAQGCL